MSTEREWRGTYERPTVVSLGSVAARTESVSKGSIIQPSDLVLKEHVSSVPDPVARLRRVSSR